jgi:hypothetical protein
MSARLGDRIPCRMRQDVRTNQNQVHYVVSGRARWTCTDTENH